MLAELQSKGFKPLPKEKKVKTVAEAATETPEDEEEEDSAAVNASAFNYLLSMPLWNLTHEKVQKLLDEKKKKEDALEQLRKTSPSDVHLLQ